MVSNRIVHGRQSVRREFSGASNLHDSRAIVGNSLLAIFIDHEQVPAIGTQGRFDSGLNGETGIDIGDNLTFALGSIGSYIR